MTDEVVGQARWLLLVHQLPRHPSNLRVNVWRRLQQVGAVALRNSLWVLPNTAESREDFDWIRTEIAGRGGQVSVLTASAVDGYTDDELEQSFRAASDAEYSSLLTDVNALARRLGAHAQRTSRAAVQREIAKARERLRVVKGKDYFAAARANEAQAALDRLDAMLLPDTAPGVSTRQRDPRSFRRRVWVTRPHPGIDRMASAWLIRRFIAPDAKFAFAAAAARAQIPFDMPDVEFGHHGSECTYETLLRRFAIEDPAAIRIGQLVHDRDLKESRYGNPDAPTVGRLVDGCRRTGTSDHDILERGMAVIEALYRSYAADLQEDKRRPARQGPSARGRQSKTSPTSRE